MAGIVSCQTPETLAPIQEDARQIKLPDVPVPVSAPDAEVVTLGLGTENQEQWEHFLNQLIVRNVTSPDLYPVRPSAKNNNGKSVIVVPGGGYAFVSVENEGFPVAQRLAEEGYTAFVLKYRTRETPRSPSEFLDQMAKQFANLGKQDRKPYHPAIEDLGTAIRYVSESCPEYDCTSGKVSLIGFSAGGMSVMKALENGASGTFIDKAALIYPPMSQSIESDLTIPIFLAIASDDPLFEQGGFSLPKVLSEMAGSLEFHLYSRGGHGFGTLRKGTTSAAWLEQYILWLAADN
ncbi:alpha/beta hydrolase [Hyphomonas oceanitis]|nr:alpha/beta hydrolase [Hyphomonas oceanitis]